MCISQEEELTKCSKHKRHEQVSHAAKISSWQLKLEQISAVFPGSAGPTVSDGTSDLTSSVAEAARISIDS